MKKQFTILLFILFTTDALFAQSAPHLVRTVKRSDSTIFTYMEEMPEFLARMHSH
ncbi:MAG: hypothetical protein IPP77_06350 [Bacteroidetes bacterium]|nr:hypothetical protein [Bacteroidota bacterium]